MSHPRDTATQCIQCGKPLQVKRYRSCWWWCSERCKHQHEAEMTLWTRQTDAAVRRCVLCGNHTIERDVCNLHPGTEAVRLVRL